MTDQRRPPSRTANRHDAPAPGIGRAPAVSGEYRTVPAAQPALRRYGTVEMQAVGPVSASAPLSAGRMLDDDFDFDIDADGALELDCLPSTHTRVEQPRQLQQEPSASLSASRLSRVTPPPARGVRPPAPAWPMASSGPRRSSSSSTVAAVAAVAAVDPHAALVAFAGFGDPPAGVFGTPTYAVRVILRRRALEGDLARARARRSPDVGLYEASLRTADAGAVRMGVAVATMMVTLTLLLASAIAYFVR